MFPVLLEPGVSLIGNDRRSSSLSEYSLELAVDQSDPLHKG